MDHFLALFIISQDKEMKLGHCLGVDFKKFKNWKKEQEKELAKVPICFFCILLYSLLQNVFIQFCFSSVLTTYQYDNPSNIILPATQSINFNQIPQYLRLQIFCYRNIFHLIWFHSHTRPLHMRMNGINRIYPIFCYNFRSHPSQTKK